MAQPKIPRSEFENRIDTLQRALPEHGLDAVLVYGDEYRKENLRYVSDFWPIFERGGCFIPRSGEPILAGAPEGEQYAREMSVWADLRNIKEFACVSVPEEIDYPLAEFSSLSDILGESLRSGNRLGIVGWFDVPATIMARIEAAYPGIELLDAGDQDLVP